MAESEANKPSNLEDAQLFEQAEGVVDDSGRKNYGNLRTLSAETFQTIYFE